MAEPIGLAMGAISLIAQVGSISRNIHGQAVYEKDATNGTDTTGELDILKALLSESVEQLNSSPMPPPLSAAIALSRCEYLISELVKIVEAREGLIVARSHNSMKYKSRRSGELKVNHEMLVAITESFKSGVLMFHSITANMAVQSAFQQPRFIVHGNGNTLTVRGEGKNAKLPSDELDESDQEPEPILHDLSEREIFGNRCVFNEAVSCVVNNAKLPSDELDESDQEHEASEDDLPQVQGNRWVFNGAVSCVVNSDPAWHGFRGCFDTQGDVNIVSYELVSRMSREHDIYDTEGIILEGLENIEYKLNRKIRLTWALNNSRRSYQTDFYVSANCPFDILLDQAFCDKNKNVMLNNKSMLTLGLRRKRGEKKQAQTQDVDDEGKTPDALEELSRKADREAREKLRQQRHSAAAATAAPGSSAGSVTGSSISGPPGQGQSSSGTGTGTGTGTSTGTGTRTTSQTSASASSSRVPSTSS